MRPRLLITGGKGLVGSYATHSLRNNFNVTSFSKDTLDIIQAKQVEIVFHQTKPDHVLHLAGLTNLK